MDTAVKPKSSSEIRVGLIPFGLPNVRSPEFLAEARRQCLAVNASPHAEDDQAFIDAISVHWDDA